MAYPDPSRPQGNPQQWPPQPLPGYPAPYGAPAPPPRRSQPWAVVLVVVAVLAVLAAGGVTVAVVLGPARTTTAGAQQSTGPAPATTTADLRAAIVAWRDGGGLDRINAMSEDAHDLTAAAGKSDVAGVKTACIHLQTDVAAAKLYRTIPDAAAQQHWSAALSYYADSATDCVAATTALDAQRMTKASTEMAQGTAELNAASARLTELAGG